MHQKQNTFRWLLFPLSIIYGLIVSFRNLLFDYNILHSQEFALPVISVGNITVGGTGKTPHIEYLIRLLKKPSKSSKLLEGSRLGSKHTGIAILSRGYKRKTNGFVLATEKSTVDEIGDEPKQIKQKFPDIHLAVSNSRVEGINKLLSKSSDDSIRAILLDDAFQHRYVKPGLSILLIDYNRPLSSDYMLPYGELREKPSEKKRADIIIITKSPSTKLSESLKLSESYNKERKIIIRDLKILPYQSLYFTSLKYGMLIPVWGSHRMTPSHPMTNKILLITGIAQPDALKKYLQSQQGGKTNVEHLKFPDHHIYSKKDIKNIIQKFNNIANKNKIIITTEKDAMRLQSFDEMINLPMYYIPLEIEFHKEDKERFNKQIMSYVRKN